MGELAYVFAGQGDQYPGMGRDLYEGYPAARGIYEMCDRIRPGTTAQCLQGTEEELRETRNTQPCLFAMELAGAAALREKGVWPDAVAGFSLGEVTAAAYSGVMDAETGFRLVCKRGELMQEAAEQFDTAMAAVLRLTQEQVLAICARHAEVYPVNYNCPGQITVAGLAARMPDFMADVKAAGGRAIPIKVAGAFHSPYMRAAAEAFAEGLSQVSLRRPQIRLYSDMTGLPYDDNPALLLSQQICSPVRWEELIRNMIGDGVDHFIEIGPGRTLTNMIHKIDERVQAVTVTEFLEEA